jgi:hypothetical protein
MSKVDRSKCSGAWPDKRSSAVIPKVPTAQSTKAATLAWRITTPFGCPVEPEVKRMWARGSGSPVRCGGVSGRAATSSGPNAMDSPPASGVCTPSQPSVAACAAGLTATISASREAEAAEARMTRGRQASTMRAARAAGFCTSTGTYRQRAPRQPSMATMASADFGSRMATRSPSRHPASRNVRASRLAAACISP